MKKIINPKASTLPVGDIQFLQAIEPPLKSEKYTLKLTQEIQGVPNPGGKETPTYISSQDFLVKGPQFSIKPTIVHALYPAPLSVGGYQRVMPNLVFNDFSLPWFRPLDPNNPTANPDTPWLGLMTVYPNEMQKEATTINEDNKFVQKTMTINQLLTPAADTLIPALDKEAIGIDLNTKVTVLEMDLSYFRAISPTLSDLEFLAHGRQVNTGGKVMLGMDADGYFSLVIGNRLPKAGLGTDTAENKILLVSYEGHAKHLRGSASPGSAYTKIRLVLLFSWKFFCAGSKGSFLDEMANLCSPGSGGVKLMQMPGVIDKVENDTAKTALQIGYTALQNKMRVGEKATSWYRGPLVPSITKRLTGEFDTFLYSDHAIHYDPKTGIFDHSYAAAWQIGRLLALSDGSFANAFFKWRNQYVRIWLNYMANNPISKQNAMLLNSEEQKGLKLDDLSVGVHALLAKSVRHLKWPQYKPRAERILGEHLKNKIGSKDLQALFEEDEDPLLALLNEKRK